MIPYIIGAIAGIAASVWRELHPGELRARLPRLGE